MAVKQSLRDQTSIFPLMPYGKLSDDVDEWITLYLEEKLVKSANTHRSYAAALKPFAMFCEEYDGIDQFSDVGATFINNFLVYYLNELAEFHRGNRVIRGKKRSERDSPNTLTDEEYDIILSNNGMKFKRDKSNIFVPRRFEKTIMHRLTTLKQLLKFVKIHSTEQHDFPAVFDKIAEIKVKDRQTDFLTIAELETLRATALAWPEIYRAHVKNPAGKSAQREVKRASSFAARRNAFLVYLISYTGLRASEALNVNMRSFDRTFNHPETGKPYYNIHVERGKGNEERFVPVPKERFEAPVDALRRIIPDGKIGVKKGGGAIGYGAFFQYLPNLYAAAGVFSKDSEGRKIPKSGAHIIRRGYATEFIALGGDIETLAKYLGHKSIQMTHELYIKNNPELLIRRSVH